MAVLPDAWSAFGFEIVAPQPQGQEGKRLLQTGDSKPGHERAQPFPDMGFLQHPGWGGGELGRRLQPLDQEGTRGELVDLLFLAVAGAHEQVGLAVLEADQGKQMGKLGGSVLLPAEGGFPQRSHLQRTDETFPCGKHSVRGGEHHGPFPFVLRSLREVPAWLGLVLGGNQFPLSPVGIGPFSPGNGGDGAIAPPADRGERLAGGRGDALAQGVPAPGKDNRAGQAGTGLQEGKVLGDGL